MGIAKEGYPFIFTPAVLALVVLTIGWQGFSLVLGFVALAFAGFFRDPERVPPQEEGLILAPADGKVVKIATGKDEGLLDEVGSRISIFLSPLDVHINRVPVEGRIDDVRYRPGNFFAAYKEKASARNEQNALTIIDPRGRKFGVVQVAGVVARRIVCHAKKGDMLSRGERFGLIMFGSRTDLILPSQCRIEVVEGQRVRGGETVVGRFYERSS